MHANPLYRKPDPILYGILTGVSKLACKCYFGMKVLRNELKGSSGRRVIIANHESVMDFLTTYAVVPPRTHAVVSRSMIHSLPVSPIAEYAGIIPKNQFQTSVRDMKRMRSVLENDGILLFYPAGLMTESGMSTPIPLATAKTLKWFNADIYVAKVSGTYLTMPKWSKVRRRGKITMDVYKLASREEFAALSPDAARALVEQHLSFDAYRNNRDHQIPFTNGDNLEGLEHVLYQCPQCGKEHTIRVEQKNRLRCSHCGFGVESDLYGALHPLENSPDLFPYPSDWHAWIEENIHRELLKDRALFMETEAEFLQIDPKKHKYVSVGKGTVTMDRDRFVIDGTLRDAPLHQEILTEDFPMLPFQPGDRFEIQQGSQIYRIRPKDGRIVMKWILTLKVLYKLRHRLYDEILTA